MKGILPVGPEESISRLEVPMKKQRRRESLDTFLCVKRLWMLRQLQARSVTFCHDGCQQNQRAEQPQQNRRAPSPTAGSTARQVAQVDPLLGGIAAGHPPRYLR
jgi:hypothetical protein